MSVSSLGAAVGPQSGVAPFVREVMNGIDTNKDGRISTNEFGTFLTKLISGLPISSANVHAGVTAAASDSPGPTAPTQLLPSSWTNNNAPYGVTFAGYSPQDHTHMTLADLATPGARKYAVYDYLLTNKIEPTNDWAPLAAEALNRKYNTTVYRAVGGDILAYDDEYVHSAPNGYGMAQGTFNPTATGEFFWGWV